MAIEKAEGHLSPKNGQASLQITIHSMDEHADKAKSLVSDITGIENNIKDLPAIYQSSTKK